MKNIKPEECLPLNSLYFIKYNTGQIEIFIYGFKTHEEAAIFTASEKRWDSVILRQEELILYINKISISMLNDTFDYEKGGPKELNIGPIYWCHVSRFDEIIKRTWFDE